jgi:hypothetical protein
MTGKLPGITALCLLAASVITGLYGISLYSVTAAGIYLVGAIIVWLVRQWPLLLVFLVLFAGNLVLTHFTCCKGCGNRFCLLRYE